MFIGNLSVGQSAPLTHGSRFFHTIVLPIKISLPPLITMHRTNCCKLIQSLYPRQSINPKRQYAGLLIIGQLVVFAMLLHVVNAFQHSQSFHFPSFDNPSLANLTFVNQDSWYGGQDAALGSQNTIWLNPDPSVVQTRAEANIGKMVYKYPITFKSPRYGTASFSTRFTFKIITTRNYPDNGSGMLFFIADYDKAPERSYGRYLGMIRPGALDAQRFFAVEFDTHISQTFDDVSGSHIGIDINSLKSVAVADTSPNSTNPQYYPTLFLYNNYTFTTWVDYNSSSNLIQVWMTNANTSQRPSETCLTFTYNLSSVFKDTMFVGFSASNNVSEDGMEGHALYSWDFTTYYPLYEHPKGRSGSSILKLVLIIVVVVVVVGIGCCSAYFFVRKRRQESTVPRSTTIRPHSGSVANPVEHSQLVPRYTFKQLKKATNNFGVDNQIGEGGYSFVYRGVLGDGSMVAVKRLKESLKKERKEAEFLGEMNVISNTRHRNLLQLQGWCCEGEEAILVYKYMNKGSLDQYLYGKDRGGLPREARLKILAGVASALEYLHFGLGDCVLHRDVKAANILLTDEFEPMLGDFGLARLISHSQSEAITMTAAGTTGYVAPEVAFSAKFSDKADVYGFGVLALEVACGRPAIDKFQLNPSEVRLVEWVWNLHLSNRLIEALDSSMRLDMPAAQVEQWKGVLHVALMCCNPSPEARPNMRQICQTLQGDNVLLTQPLPSSRAWAPPLNENWPSASESSTSAH